MGSYVNAKMKMKGLEDSNPKEGFNLQLKKENGGIWRDCFMSPVLV